MKKKGSKNGDAQSATARNRCIWMTAGVISFKLCPLNYDCEHCGFDQAMRSQVSSRGARSKVKRQKGKDLATSEAPRMAVGDSRKVPAFFTFSVGDVGGELYLHPTHLWMLRLGDQKWILGIDELLAYVLPRPSEVELYGLNSKVIQSQLVGKVHTSVGTIPLAVPLSGRVVQINPLLGQTPELLQQDPYGEGWLATMESFQDDFDLKKYYTGPARRRFLEEEAQHLRFLLKHRGIEVDNIGATLPDGGASIRHLHQVLPGQVCLRLASELIATGKQGW
jgi:glycine cleavage system H protein